MKLKTLKDMRTKGINVSQADVVLIEELRQEAIKWINSFGDAENMTIGRWIKHFFNITDKDLK